MGGTMIHRVTRFRFETDGHLALVGVYSTDREEGARAYVQLAGTELGHGPRWLSDEIAIVEGGSHRYLMVVTSDELKARIEAQDG